MSIETKDMFDGVLEILHRLISQVTDMKKGSHLQTSMLDHIKELEKILNA